MPAVLIVRHAESTWNAAHRWQGQADPPLSATGELEAGAAGEILARGEPFDLVVSSGLVRAVATADLLAMGSRGAPRLVEPDLGELDVGAWSGLTRDEIEQRWPGRLAAVGEGRLAPPGGEQRQAFDARVQRASRAGACAALLMGADRVLVVTHGGVIRSLARSARLGDSPVPLLSGYWGSIGPRGFVPTSPADLLIGSERR